MKITDLLEENSIKLKAMPASKQEALNQIINIISKTGNISNKEEYKKVVLNREKQGTTGIGEGIAIPHGKSNVVKKATLAAMVIQKGVDFEALDNKKVNLMFLIAAPETKDNIHLEVLSRLSALLMDEKFREKLKNAKTPKEFINYIDEAEKAKYEEEKDVDELISEKAGEESGYKIKVETQGQSGVKNHLTKEEIENAKAIIVAADTNVDLSRFNGKKLIKTRVADGIHKPKELIEKALLKDAPIYYSSGSEGDTSFNQDE